MHHASLLVRTASAGVEAHVGSLNCCFLSSAEWALPGLSWGFCKVWGPLWLPQMQIGLRSKRDVHFCLQVDVGLCVKHVQQSLCVPDFARPQADNQGWLYSQALLQVVQKYKVHPSSPPAIPLSPSGALCFGSPNIGALIQLLCCDLVQLPCTNGYLQLYPNYLFSVCTG